MLVDADGIEYEVDDGVGKNGDDQTDDGIEDGVFGVGDFFAIASRNDISEAAEDEHDDGDCTDDEEDGVGDLSEYSCRSNQFCRHAVGSGRCSAFLNTDGHGFTRTDDESGADPS